MKRNQSGFALIDTILVILIIVVAAVGGYGIWHNEKNKNKPAVSSSTQTSSTPPAANMPSNSSSETSNETLSETYKNDEYGFSFKYPSSWKLATDLKDMGRDAKEGTVSVTSPNGTVVHFDPNQGGKGGDCADPQANDQYTTRTCTTRTIYSVTKLPNSPQDVYFIEASDKAPLEGGGKTTYFVYLGTNGYDNNGNQTVPPSIGSNLGAFIGTYDDVSTYGKHVGGNVSVSVSGVDDSRNSTNTFFTSNEVKEATPVLESFVLN